MNAASRVRAPRRAAGNVEFILLVGMVAVAAILAVTWFGRRVGGNLNRATGALDGGSPESYDPAAAADERESPADGTTGSAPPLPANGPVTKVPTKAPTGTSAGPLTRDGKSNPLNPQPGQAGADDFSGRVSRLPMPKDHPKAAEIREQFAKVKNIDDLRRAVAHLTKIESGADGTYTPSKMDPAVRRLYIEGLRLLADMHEARAREAKTEFDRVSNQMSAKEYREMAQKGQKAEDDFVKGTIQDLR